MVKSVSEGGLDASHRPVLLHESLGFLQPENGRLFVDATLGMGGHSERILEAANETRVIGFDRDPAAIELATRRLARFGARFRAINRDYRDITAVLAEADVASVSGVLADLGVSSLQFDTSERGFSFRYDAPLDMRMNPTGDEASAAELLARLPEEEIARIIYEYGEERLSRRIARRIVERRERGEPVQSTIELADLVARAVGGRSKGNKRRKGEERIHPATRTFQALRIKVNGELEGLDKFIEDSIALLIPGGRFVCISFHSLEDRIVKRTLRRLSGRCECDPRAPVCMCGARRQVEILTARPVVPAEAEENENPRARSAKLRACERLT